EFGVLSGLRGVGYRIGSFHHNCCRARAEAWRVALVVGGAVGLRNHVAFLEPLEIDSDGVFM
ncbi:MAG: hypothetical protein AVDCRST_MAG28-1479, partial [uncultured Rubrobacteraceae bacterium]